MTSDAVTHAEEMVDKLREIPDNWLRNFQGLIMCIVTDENVGANVSHDLIHELTDEQKISIIAMIAKSLGLEYSILSDYMDVNLKQFDHFDQDFWRASQ